VNHKVENVEQTFQPKMLLLKSECTSSARTFSGSTITRTSWSVARVLVDSLVSGEGVDCGSCGFVASPKSVVEVFAVVCPVILQKLNRQTVVLPQYLVE